MCSFVRWLLQKEGLGSCFAFDNNCRFINDIQMTLNKEIFYNFPSSSTLTIKYSENVTSKYNNTSHAFILLTDEISRNYLEIAEPGRVLEALMRTLWLFKDVKCCRLGYTELQTETESASVTSDFLSCSLSIDWASLAQIDWWSDLVSLEFRKQLKGSTGRGEMTMI